MTHMFKSFSAEIKRIFTSNAFTFTTTITKQLSQLETETVVDDN